MDNIGIYGLLKQTSIDSNFKFTELLKLEQMLFLIGDGLIAFSDVNQKNRHPTKTTTVVV